MIEGGGRLAARLGTTALLILLAGLCYAQPAQGPACSFARPPAWPSFHYQALDRDGLAHLGDPDVTPPADGVIVLGWLGTSMRGTPIRVWMYTRPDKSIVHSRLLHADALERLYGEVEAWLEQQEKAAPVAPDVPRLRVTR